MTEAQGQRQRVSSACTGTRANDGCRFRSEVPVLLTIVLAAHTVCQNAVAYESGTTIDGNGRKATRRSCVPLSAKRLKSLQTTSPLGSAIFLCAQPPHQPCARFFFARSRHANPTRGFSLRGHLPIQPHVVLSTIHLSGAPHFHSRFFQFHHGLFPACCNALLCRPALECDAF